MCLTKSIRCLLFIYQNLSVEFDPKLFLGITIFEFQVFVFSIRPRMVDSKSSGKRLFVVRNGPKRQIPARVSRPLENAGKCRHTGTFCE